jgi:hypothetical protein
MPAGIFPRVVRCWGVDTIDYGGMTGNERLFAAGLLGAFDDAVRNGDRDRMIEMLRVVQVDQAEQMADGILSHPTRYGRIDQR